MKKLTYLITLVLITSCGTSKRIAPIEVDMLLNATETTIEPILTNKELRHERKEQKQADKQALELAKIESNETIKVARINKRKTKIEVKQHSKDVKQETKQVISTNKATVKIEKQETKQTKIIAKLEAKLSKYEKQIATSDNKVKIFRSVTIGLGILLLILILLIVFYYSRKIVP